jgi:hypothetical protein
VVGVADTVTVLVTCFVDLTALAPGAATRPTVNAQTAAAPSSFFISNPFV